MQNQYKTVRLNLLFSGLTYGEFEEANKLQQYVRKLVAAVEWSRKFDFQDEMEWKKLENMANDALLHPGVMMSRF